MNLEDQAAIAEQRNADGHFDEVMNELRKHAPIFTIEQFERIVAFCEVEIKERDPDWAREFQEFQNELPF